MTKSILLCKAMLLSLLMTTTTFAQVDVLNNSGKPVQIYRFANFSDLKGLDSVDDVLSLFRGIINSDLSGKSIDHQKSLTYNFNSFGGEHYVLALTRNAEKPKKFFCIPYSIPQGVHYAKVQDNNAKLVVGANGSINVVEGKAEVLFGGFQDFLKG